MGVLNVGRLAPGAADYYCAEVARSPADYYAGRAKAPGRWVGTLAAEWGLAGLVGRDELAAPLAGRHPRSGEVLVRGRDGTRRRDRPPRSSGSPPSGGACGPGPASTSPYRSPKSVSVV